ncbi:MAG: rRNA maturation RNase YbeY [Hyphomicrobiaceae bacterium]
MDDNRDSPRSHQRQHDESGDETDPALSITQVGLAGDWTAYGPVCPMLLQLEIAIARHAELPNRNCAAVVAFADDTEIRVLNRKFRSTDKATNVLSFPAAVTGFTMVPPDHGAPRLALGDVILAEETIRREALESRIALRDHLAHLIVHGVLHLIGHDHGTDRDADVMEQVEISILADLGIPNPYCNEIEEVAN